MPPVTRRDLLEALAEHDGHVALRLVDGTTLEGWILEVDADTLTFDHAPSPFHAQATGSDEMAPPPTVIPIRAIAAYLDEARRWRLLPAD